MRISKDPTWLKGVPLETHYPKFEGFMNADVVIIGGGMTGLLTAYLLSKTNLKVVLIEKDKLYSGATTVTTAFITQAVDTSLADLVDMFGAKKAKLAWQSGSEAIDLIEEIVKKEKIECEFKKVPAYIYANEEEDNESLRQETKVAKKLGFKVKFSEKNNLNFTNKGYLEIKNQAKFHPLKFLSKLTKVISKKVEIFENSEALEAKENLVITKEGSISTSWIIIATHLPFNNPIQTFMKKGTYISYVLEAKVKNHQLKEGIYMDTEIPYHYFRVDGDNITLGGEDHRAEFNLPKTKIYKSLEAYLKQILPGKKYQLTRKWSGPIIESSDGLALIGKISDSILVASGHSGNGITYAAIAAIVLKDIILDKDNPWVATYDPKRIPNIKQLWKKGADYTKEFINVAVAHTLSRK